MNKKEIKDLMESLGYYPFREPRYSPGVVFFPGFRARSIATVGNTLDLAGVAHFPWVEDGDPSHHIRVLHE